MNTPTANNDLSCFRIVEDERDGAFFIHAYSASCKQVVEVSTHWDRASAERALAESLVGRTVRAIAGVHSQIFSVVGKVLTVGDETRLDFAGKIYTCPTAWFSHYFQSCLS